MTFLLVMVFWVFSICLHEFGHAAVAYWGGDTSVRDKGYLSFNPMRYMDPVSSLFIPMIILALGGIGLPGGAVYINTSLLRSRAWETAVSLAGPATNLMFAIVLGSIVRLDFVSGTHAAPILAFLAWLQVCAAVLNLLPIPPLDGYGALAPYLPHNVRQQFESVGYFGIFILIALLWFSQTANGLFFGFIFMFSAALGVPIGDAIQGYQDFTSALRGSIL
ncbi:MAG: site-2 protease family protein [Alphaproteobacteria bacterium]